MLFERLTEIEKAALESLNNCDNLDTLEQLRIQILGKKGSMTALFREMGSLSAEDKKEFGKQINISKKNISSALETKKTSLSEALKAQKLKAERIDISLPSKEISRGSTHPITLVVKDIIRIFGKMGFKVADGPELEQEYYNFDALNLPADHPARDEQDSFYVNKNNLLRTQTSNVQIRVMEKEKPPLAVIAPGRCYRKDTVDATHSPIFHQVEGLLVDKNVSFTDLKGTLSLFAKEMFGSGTKVRFRPDFFPFTEPSAEVAFTCIGCGGSGCSMCKGSGWIEIAGCGMVDPAVFSAVDIDYEKYKGFAFGMGIERIAMLKYGIPDIRLFYQNDAEFLSQFK